MNDDNVDTVRIDYIHTHSYTHTMIRDDDDEPQ